ncbi:hypothetical protein CAEBREN_06266 [Caenorhabditis brenneri]|uniref:Uncharacterized protein n=1 Tax=Caenorhabditis brenneri TaxID=135651 RepID=G0P3U5_CAEBE|nr:hypothetical protein CAEBREN_06266 [Caenorhabditis brenneri]
MMIQTPALLYGTKEHQDKFIKAHQRTVEFYRDTQFSVLKPFLSEILFDPDQFAAPIPQVKEKPLFAVQVQTLHRKLVDASGAANKERRKDQTNDNSVEYWREKTEIPDKEILFQIRMGLITSADNGTSQDSPGRRKPCKTRRYTPSPPPPSGQDATAQTNTRKPRQPRQQLASGPGKSRAGQVSREARFQKKKQIFLATRGTDLQPRSETHYIKIAEAEVHCSESEVYNYRKLREFLSLICLYANNPNVLRTNHVTPPHHALRPQLHWPPSASQDRQEGQRQGALPQVKLGELEWEKLIRKKDPAYEEWWGLAVKVDEEQLEQMELGWTTGSASDFGIGEEEDDARPSGRDYREFSIY